MKKGKIGVERINGIKRRAKEMKKRETTEDTKRRGKEEGGRRIVHVLTQLCPCLDNLLPAPCQAG